VSEIVIRAAELSDADALHDIFNQPNVQANSLQLPWRSLAQRRDWLARVSSDGHVLVAEIDGRVVGNLGLHIQSTTRRRDVASFGMSVHDDFQGRGIGSALMQAMLELADNWLGLRRIELEVYADNVRAIHLYEKFGFVVEGTGRQWARRNGELVDALYMARLKA
jgi:L-phenylalanine/L-methionine N-acetyltransferase